MLLHKKSDQEPLFKKEASLMGGSSTTLNDSADYQTIIITWIASIIWLIATIGVSIIISPALLVVMCLIPLAILILSPLSGLVFYLSVALWQNTTIGIWSPYLSSGQLTIMQGTNFLVCALFGCYCFFKLLFTEDKLSPVAQKVIMTAFIFLLLAGLYLAYGAVANSIFNAAAYFRNFTVGIFCLAIGAYASKTVSLETHIKLWLFFAVIVLGQAFMEFFFTRFYYRVFNLHYLYAIKYSMDVVSLDGTIDQLRTTFFNSPYFEGLNITSFRILGPTFHAISFGYVLSFFAMIAFIARKYSIVLCSILFILIIGTKGLTIMVFLSIGLVWMTRLGFDRAFVVRIATVLCGMLIPVIFLYGYSVRDYHVLGLIGGIRGFLSFPIGEGFGYGGNLAGIDSKPWWLQAQLSGSTPFGLESSVSVLLNQWGVFGLAFIVFMITFWRRLLNSFREKGAEYIKKHDFSILYFAYGFMMVNCVFQEEVLSPYGLGFAFLWLGFLINYTVSCEDLNLEDKKKSLFEKKSHSLSPKALTIS